MEQLVELDIPEGDDHVDAGNKFTQILYKIQVKTRFPTVRHPSFQFMLFDQGKTRVHGLQNCTAEEMREAINSFKEKTGCDARLVTPEPKTERSERVPFGGRGAKWPSFSGAIQGDHLPWTT